MRKVGVWEVSQSEDSQNGNRAFYKGEIQGCFNLITKLCLTLCDPMDYSLPGSSVHGILQARFLEWLAISFSRESSRPRN